MKDLLKFLVALLAGMVLSMIIGAILFVSCISNISFDESMEIHVPEKAILKIDLSKIAFSEQTVAQDPFTMLQSQNMDIAPLGILDAVNAINVAATDSRIQYIYLKTDGGSASITQLEELRIALKKFRQSGKAVLTYFESPTNGAYYLASASDKILMGTHEGGLSSLTGLSTNMIFIKDLLDAVGINMQLIRHGKYKSAGEMFIRNSASKENYQQNLELVNSLWKTLSEEIAKDRQISVADLDRIINNLELVSPLDWVKCGLVDELTTLDGLKKELCTLAYVEKYEDLEAISLCNYASLHPAAQINMNAKNKVAVVFFNGEIIDGEGLEQIAGDRYARMLYDIRQDESIKALVIRVNSPGGSVLASEKIKSELDLFEIPIIASYGDYAASGGYWISACSDYIISNSTCLTGSIGVFSMIPDFSKTMKDKLHVNITHINTHKHGDMLSGMRPLDNSEIAYLQSSVESIYDKFTTIVATGRNMEKNDVDEIAQGRVWSGADALEIGLVDQIGTLQDALSYAALSIEGVTDISQVAIEQYPKPLTMMESLMEMLGGSQKEEYIFEGTHFENVEMAFRSKDACQAGKMYARMPYDITIR